MDRSVAPVGMVGRAERYMGAEIGRINIRSNESTDKYGTSDISTVREEVQI